MVGSGGKGKFKGGDGVIRELEFLQDGIQVSLLTERRVFEPYGMAQGENGQRGENLWIRQNGVLNVGAKNSFKAKKHDRVRISTPGGGGYGPQLP